MIFDLDLRTWPRYGKAEPSYWVSRSKVIYFKTYCSDTHTSGRLLIWTAKVIAVNRVQSIELQVSIILITN